MAAPRAIMVQGTGSDVGKSLVVAGLCRALTRRGYRVRPFKAQNMSNNASVTADGGEIGRAQALQARACHVQPDVDMNPILLKPESDSGSQVVLRGRVAGTLAAATFRSRHKEFLAAACESFHRLAAEADIVLVEGAGSASEINLRAGDVANMGLAEALGLPVVLVADIHRGGVIANLVGTAAVLSPADRARVQGFLVNQFRGDPALFADGLDLITAHTGWQSFGVLPYWPPAAQLPAEDSMALERASVKSDRAIRIGVPKLRRIANFDDLDPLDQEEDVEIVLIRPYCAMPGDLDAVIIPGSKSTIADTSYFREQGWDVDLAAHIRRGGIVVGLCGGFQMLGRRIVDPDGVEGPAGAIDGLGHLAVETRLAGSKILRRVVGQSVTGGAPVEGYEMHLGQTFGQDLDRPFLTLDGRPEGAVSGDGRVMGTYLHGVFASDPFRHMFLAGLSPERRAGGSYEHRVDETLDGLAAHMEQSIGIDGLLQVATEV